MKILIAYFFYGVALIMFLFIRENRGSYPVNMDDDLDFEEHILREMGTNEPVSTAFIEEIPDDVTYGKALPQVEEFYDYDDYLNPNPIYSNTTPSHDIPSETIPKVEAVPEVKKFDGYQDFSTSDPISFNTTPSRDFPSETIPSNSIPSTSNAHEGVSINKEPAFKFLKNPTLITATKDVLELCTKQDNLNVLNHASKITSSYIRVYNLFRADKYKDIPGELKLHLIQYLTLIFQHLFAHLDNVSMPEVSLEEEKTVPCKTLEDDTFIRSISPEEKLDKYGDVTTVNYGYRAEKFLGEKLSLSDTREESFTGSQIKKVRAIPDLVRQREAILEFDCSQRLEISSDSTLNYLQGIKKTKRKSDAVTETEPLQMTSFTVLNCSYYDYVTKTEITDSKFTLVKRMVQFYQGNQLIAHNEIYQSYKRNSSSNNMERVKFLDGGRIYLNVVYSSRERPSPPLRVYLD